MSYEIRFWNSANECIRVAGKYAHCFDTREEAWEAASALAKAALKLGAVEMDIENEFYTVSDQCD